MKIAHALAPAAFSVAVVLAVPGFAQSKDEEAREKPVQMNRVPQAARDAAQKQLGSAPTEAKIVGGTNPQEYELEGKNSAGKEVGVHVRADGTVVKTESEHEDKD
jgi:uncharacterized protein YpmB